MNIYCFTNFSKKPNSTARPSGTGTLHSCVFKDDCSIVSPVFLLDGVDLSVNYVQFNNRYYFVRDIVLQNRNIYELHCEIDVLATWKSEIGSSSQYVLRSSAASDGTIVDLFYPTKKSPLIIDTAATTTTTFAGHLDGGWYVVGIISGSSSSAISQGVVQYYAFSSSQFNTFTQTLFTTSNWTDFQTADRYSFNPIQYIASVKWFPYEPPISYTISSLKIGWETMYFTCYPLVLSTDVRQFTWTASTHPQASSRGVYLNSSPFSKYELVFAPFGDFVLDGDAVARAYGHVIYGSLKTDYITGRAMLRIRAQMDDVSHDYEFARRDVQLGVTIQVSQIAADRIGAASGVVGTVGGAISSLLSGNVIGAITGTLSGIGSAYQTLQPRVVSSGSNDSLAGVSGANLTHTLYQTFYYVVDEDNTNHGRPLCQVKTISSIAGYILTANAEVSITGTLEEKQRIQSMMDAGFFYE